MRDVYRLTRDAYDRAAVVYADLVSGLLLPAEMGIFLGCLSGVDLLDLGCGSGRDSHFFADLGFDVTGIDLSKELIRIARRENIDFRVMDMLSLDFPDCSFDGVWACASYLHLAKSDFPRALSETYRVLRSGGVLFASLKDGEGERMLYSSLLGVDRFFAFYSFDEATHYLLDAGFSILCAERERVVDHYQDAGWLRFFCRKP